MQQYIYLVVAVIVVLGVGVGGIVLFNRGRKADQEDLALALAGPADPDDADPSGLKTPASVATPAQSDNLQGVEPSLTERRADNASAGANGGAAGQHAASVAVSLAEADALPYDADGTGSAVQELLADPLRFVILDMLDGKGKLTGQELKVLEVFRPKRIELATRAMELPSRLENDENAVLRLAQIQLYAATLELRSKWASQVYRPGDGTLPDVPFSARDFKLKIARDIMALPASDRSEVIGFLLGGLLASNGSSPELKRAVIDTLEHLHSAALVNVLLDCLDDPDPIVQEYALTAADRLLDE